MDKSTTDNSSVKIPANNNTNAVDNDKTATNSKNSEVAAESEVTIDKTAKYPDGTTKDVTGESAQEVTENGKYGVNLNNSIIYHNGEKMGSVKNLV